MEFSLQWHTECLNTDHMDKGYGGISTFYVENIKDHKYVQYHRLPEHMYKRACMIYFVSFFAKKYVHMFSTDCPLPQYKNTVYEEKHFDYYFGLIELLQVYKSNKRSHTELTYKIPSCVG